MNDGLELHATELRTIADEIRKIAADMEANLDRASSRVQTLVNSYQGQAASAFLQNYNTQLKPQFVVICQKIIAVANFITSSVNSYEAQDKASAEAANNIQAG